jgi:transposase-like protein
MKYSEEEKAMWLEDWQRSGKSAWAYAKENGISVQTFINWTKKNRESKGCFVEVPAQIITPMQAQYAVEILIEKGEVKIHIPLAIGCNELRTIFGALGNAV